MYISAEGAQAQAQRLEVIANNLANVETPGYKRDVPTFQARFAEAIQQGTALEGDGSINDVGGGVKIVQTQTDFSRSSLRHTKIDTDFAIQGDGFFQLLADDGQTLLTRAGNFFINPEGQLLSRTERLPVLDEGGAPIQLNADQPWQLLSGGILEQQGSQTALGLVAPESLGDLVKAGHNAFRSLGPLSPVAERDVRQGYLEQSGVNPTRETMAMIETSRAFEANMKLVQHQDSMISGLIHRVLGQS